MLFKAVKFLSVGFILSSCQTAVEPIKTAQPTVARGESIEALTFVQMKNLFSEKTFATPREKTGGSFKQSITYLRGDVNRAYRYYPHWTKTGLDYYALGKITKESVKGPRTFSGKTFHNLQAFCITDELSRNSKACSTVFRKGTRYYLGTDLSAEIVFADGYHNLLTPLVKRAVADNNNKLLWALAEDFKRLEPDLVAKYKLANMRVWAQNQNEIQAENARIEADRKRIKEKRIAKAKADNKAREAKCRRETGKACPSGGGLMGAVIGAGLKALENSSKAGSKTSSTRPTYTPKYGCQFVCEGAFGAAKSGKFKVNTPHTNSADAQEYVRRKYEKTCSKYPFHGKTGTGADVSYPYCETYYYTD
jgi:hypothetical protein